MNHSIVAACGRRAASRSLLRHESNKARGMGQRWRFSSSSPPQPPTNKPSFDELIRGMPNRQKEPPAAGGDRERGRFGMRATGGSSGPNPQQRRPPMRQFKPAQAGSNLSELTELMKKFRSAPKPKPIEPSHHREQVRPPPSQSLRWTENFRLLPQLSRPMERGDQRGGPGRRPARGPEERFQPRRGPDQMQRPAQNRPPRQRFQRFQPNAAPVVAKGPIELPHYDMSLHDVSALLRIKLDVIKRTLKRLGVAMPQEPDKNFDPKSIIGDERKKAERRKMLEDIEKFKIDVDTVELVAMENKISVERSKNQVAELMEDDELLLQRRAAADQDENEADSTLTSWTPRPPVVCICGHVDHGKTTLMDALRRRAAEQDQKTTKSKKKSKKKGKEPAKAGNVAGTEAGGITQVISAFQVAVEGAEVGSEGDNNLITFLDTPGHAAFKSMRQSGSHAADVIVLVVAADDGVSPQTIEIIDFYKSIVKGSNDSGISMVVALNKIDKPGIDVDEAKFRIENQLLEHGIVSEGMRFDGDSKYGQPVQVFPTSGLTGLGLDDLMEGLLLQSEVMDLKADRTASGEGIVMDGRLEKGLGTTVDCIIRWGSIKRGDVVVSGTEFGKVKILKDVNNKAIKVGTPSQPVRIIGFKNLPKAGDAIMVVESEEEAEKLVERRRAAHGDDSNNSRAGGEQEVSLQIHGIRVADSRRVQRVQNMADIGEKSGTVTIPIIVKADADASLSAVREALLEIAVQSKFDIEIDPIAEGIGPVNPTEIALAKDSDAIIFAFGFDNLDQATKRQAEEEGVTIEVNDIIYSLLDNAKIHMGKYIPQVPVEHVHGAAKIQEIFEIGVGAGGTERIAGLKVTEGNIYKSQAPDVDGKCQFRVFRDGKLVSPPEESRRRVTAESLRHYKELVESVRSGEECGLGLKGFSDYKEGDVIECFSIEMQSVSV